MRNWIDFSSWQGLASTLLGLVLVTLVAVGIRLLVMQRIQQRRERQNRQINERLRKEGSKLVYRCAKQNSAASPPVTSAVPRLMSCTSHRWS